MKHYKLLIVTMILSVIAGLAVSAAVMSTQDNRGEDVILLNDIARTAQEHWSEQENLPAYLDGCSSGMDYVIFDKDENIVCSSGERQISSLSDAIRDHYLYMMITDGDRILGSAVVMVSLEADYSRKRTVAFAMTILSGIGMIGCVIIWGIYVRRSVVRPFRKMERFAAEVAAGNLDFPLDMEEDNIFGIFTESFDIMREELAASREREIILKKREKELIASLSHDLKTPVTGIKLTAELMQAQTTEPAAAEKLSNIYKKAEQIDALVNDLFTSTMKDLGEMKVKVCEENSQILHEFVKRCDDKKLVSESPIPECLLKLDPQRMEQVVWNVISNSYKYAGTPITIIYEINGSCMRMSVRDSGPGVPEDELMLVTNKFYRSRVHESGGIQGSGLGLYIVRMLMENMGGEVNCLNANPGFEVRIFIPLA